jgi:hypothetical protein
MRCFTTSILLFGLLLVTAPGCQNPSLQCRRETALLRAEILDLEDKYYALKSQHESGMISDGSYVTNGVVTDGIIENGIVVGNQVMGAPIASDSYPMIEGDIIYEDQMLPGSPSVLQAPMAGEVYYENQTMPGIQTLPTPAEPESLDLQLEPSPAETLPQTETSNDEDDQAIALPYAPELKVGHTELELDAFGEEVERIEIVSSATRGKNLDGIPGDEGIELMVRTVGADGEFIDRNGEMTITVGDQLVGEIGKWTFLPEELKLFLSQDELGNKGTLLHLPWTDRVPVSKRVSIRVAMMIDGIQYIATQQIGIKPPTNQISEDTVVGWTTNDTRWVSDANPRPVKRQNAAPIRAPKKSPSTAVKRPQWKPVR